MLVIRAMEKNKNRKKDENVRGGEGLQLQVTSEGFTGMTLR